jgi:GNAT superfamily N-acetyltransferase
MIRRATEQDIPRLIEMGQRFVAETEYRDLVDAKPEQLEHTISLMLASPANVVLVSESKEAVTGMLAAVVYEHPFSGTLTGSELVWWVDPEARGDGLRLLRAAEAWAKDAGASRMQMVAPNEKVATLYRRLGYVEMETAFQRSL